jgi:hypothetical protein
MRTAESGFDRTVEAGRESEQRTFRVDRIARSKRDGGYLYYPSLRLVGRWLERAGFEYGCRVTVVVQSGRLVVTAQE